jgi:hypothetical protein
VTTTTVTGPVPRQLIDWRTPPAETVCTSIPVGRGRCTLATGAGVGRGVTTTAGVARGAAGLVGDGVGAADGEVGDGAGVVLAAAGVVGSVVALTGAA